MHLSDFELSLMVENCYFLLFLNVDLRIGLLFLHVLVMSNLLLSLLVTRIGIYNLLRFVDESVAKWFI
jgi:hypothetical protein